MIKRQSNIWLLFAPMSNSSPIPEKTKCEFWRQRQDALWELAALRNLEYREEQQWLVRSGIASRPIYTQFGELREPCFRVGHSLSPRVRFRHTTISLASGC